MANRKIVLEGRGPLTLSDNDHMATGGEGSVFKKAGTVVKIYSDPNKMSRDGMAEKIHLLSKIKHDFIVAPVGLVMNESGNAIGYYMPFAQAEPLPRLFTNDFRQKVGFDDSDASKFVNGMRDAVKIAHDHKAVMVDANELNWLAVLAQKKNPEPRVIDVDSWAIGRWPAKVIMLSIRDWHSSRFDEKSDWFAWGIVTFQVYTGIHPYKGILDGYKPAELKRRMVANASVFTSGVRLNHAVRDFKCIPGRLRDWYIATFQNGERTIPPSPFDIGVAVTQVAKIARVVVTASGRLSHEKIFGKTNDPVVEVFSCGVVLLKSGALVDLKTKRQISTSRSSDCEVIETAEGWVRAEKVGKKFEYAFIDKTSFIEVPLSLNFEGKRLFRYRNRLFLITDNGLSELLFRVLGKPILSVGNTWGVMVTSTRWFDGVGIQDAMGATFAVLPFGDNACTQVRVRELDGLTPVSGKAGNRFVSIVAIDRAGDYQKIELSFDSDYKSYSVWKGGAVGPELNMAVLPRGVCATITEDGELVIFVPSNGKVSKIQDSAVTTEMSLTDWEDSVLYILDGNVWKLSLKNK